MKNNNLILKILNIFLVIYIVSTIGFGFIIHTAQAQTNPTYTLLEPLPSIGSTSQSTMQPSITLNDYIIYAINLLIAVAAAAAVFMIVWGGLQYMTTDSWGGKSAGLEKVKNAIIGLLMVLSTYIILRTVNPALVNIPAPLVPSIENLQYASSSDLFSQLQSEANQLNTQAQASVDAAKQAQLAVNNLKDKLSAAQQEYDHECAAVGLEDPSCVKLYAEISNLNDQISSTTANLAVSNNNGITTNMVAGLTNDLSQIVANLSGGSFGSLNGDASINDASLKAINQINTTTINRVAQLQTIPGSTAQIIQVQDQQQYADIQVLVKMAVALQGQYTKNNGSITTGLISDLDRYAAPYLSSIKNADVAKQATDLLASTKTQLTQNIK